MIQILRTAVVFTLFLGACRQPATFQKDIVDYVQLEHSLLEVSTIADSLLVPWELALYGEEKIFFTEIAGLVKQVDLRSGEVKTILNLQDQVFHKRTTGLLGMAVQKGVGKEPYVLLNYTTKGDSAIVSNLVRYRYAADSLVDPQLLLTVKGATGHNGTRLLLNKDDMIFWATGDAADFSQSQDSTTLNGKILRLALDGTVPADNPIPGSYVYAWGFRNMQGLALDARGNLYASEHGDAIEDEINLIKPLHNYGWPQIEGKHDLAAEQALAAGSPRQEPILSWTPVIAPAGLAYYQHAAIPEWSNALLLGTLKSQTLRILKLNEQGTAITDEELFFSNRYGRIRAVMTAPNGDIYLSTSNTDWNPQPGFPKPTDDRILRIRAVEAIPAGVSPIAKDAKRASVAKSDGHLLYTNYCASCHKADGLGVAQSFPPLKGSQKLAQQHSFLELLLQGSTGKEPIDGVLYGTAMPSFNFLKDAEVAAIANYINQAFGDASWAITAEEVKKNR